MWSVNAFLLILSAFALEISLCLVFSSCSWDWRWLCLQMGHSSSHKQCFLPPPCTRSVLFSAWWGWTWQRPEDSHKLALKTQDDMKVTWNELDWIFIIMGYFVLPERVYRSKESRRGRMFRYMGDIHNHSHSHFLPVYTNTDERFEQHWYIKSILHIWSFYQHGAYQTWSQSGSVVW